MWSPSTSMTVPSSSARSMSAASRAAFASTPVPTYGASARTSGTACFCMLAPMSARLASSCSRNGMSDVATETICFGDTSISWTSSGGTERDLGGRGEVDVALELQLQVGQRARLRRAPREHAVLLERAVRRSSGALAWATTYSSSSSAARYTMLVRDLAVDDLAVRRLDEAELVHAGVGRQRADEADVRAFRRLDRAHAAVVREVDVADLEAGPLAGQTTRAERAEAAAMGEARQRVDLVHELRQLDWCRRTP